MSGANNHLIVDTTTQVLTRSSTRARRQCIVAIPRIGRHGVRFREWRFAGSNRLFGRLPVLLNVLRGSGLASELRAQGDFLSVAACEVRPEARKPVTHVHGP